MNRFIEKIFRFLCFIFFLLLNLSLIFQIYLGRINITSTHNELIIENNESNGNILNRTNKWILNNRLYQYSSSLLVKNGLLKQIDSIILLTTDFEEYEIKHTFRCILKWTESSDEIEFSVDSVYNLSSNLRRVQCEVNKDINNSILTSIAIAIINIYDFKKYDESTSLSKEEIESTFYKLPRNMMNFQTPRIIEIPEKKLEKVAHCVDYTYNINDNYCSKKKYLYSKFRI